MFSSLRYLYSCFLPSLSMCVSFLFHVLCSHLFCSLSSSIVSSVIIFSLFLYHTLSCFPVPRLSFLKFYLPLTSKTVFTPFVIFLALSVLLHSHFPLFVSHFTLLLPHFPIVLVLSHIALFPHSVLTLLRVVPVGRESTTGPLFARVITANWP